MGVIKTVTELGYGLFVFDGESAQLCQPKLPEEPEGNTVVAPRGWPPPTLSQLAESRLPRR